MGVHRHSTVFTTPSEDPAAWQFDLDSKAKAIHATSNWLHRHEKEAGDDLYRRLFGLRQTVWATSQWDKINDERLRNSPKKTEEE